MVRFATVIGGLTAAASVATAHPGEKHDHVKLKRQIEARNQMAAAARRSLDACSGSLKHRELMARSVERRAKTLNMLREKRGLTAHNPMKYRRDLATLEEFSAVDHNMTASVDYTADTDPSAIFSAETSCILAPELTAGPYYVTGEVLRSNVKEDLYCDGVDLYLEAQYIDISTCEPVSDVYVDAWSANATGTYSGISLSGNYAAGGWNSTFLRGVQVTDDDGVVSFETIFPGHYSGRTIHTHLLAKMDATYNSGNDTITGGRVSHIGQVFYPTDLITAVESIYPYNTNTEELTSNEDDMWSIVQAADDYDPFPEFVYLGEDVSDGLLAWIQIGINTTVDYVDDDYYAVAAERTEDGVVVNEDGFGGGDGGEMPSGAMPSGEMPSGAAPTDMATPTSTA